MGSAARAVCHSCSPIPVIMIARLIADWCWVEALGVGAWPQAKPAGERQAGEATSAAASSAAGAASPSAAASSAGRYVRAAAPAAAVASGASPYPIADAAALARMAAVSPIQYIDNITAPTLLTLGMKDRRVPASQGVEMYYALKARGVTTR